MFRLGQTHPSAMATWDFDDRTTAEQFGTMQKPVMDRMECYLRLYDTETGEVSNV